ncbi:hypothetical protein FHT44_005206 [Mycolicibacterium sp. BK634]|nr:hypothetical protein [Mycolicibacterium sp. BK634]
MSKVQINYKSGRSIVIKCEDFKATRVGSDLRKVEWRAAVPDPLFIGLDDIESIWEL